MSQDDTSTNTSEEGEGHEDPKTGKPIVVMAYSVSAASCVYIVDTVCQWVGQVL